MVAIPRIDEIVATFRRDGGPVAALGNLASLVREQRSRRAVAPQFDNLVEMFERSVHTHGSRPLFGTKRDGQWAWLGYREIGRLVDRMRGGLAALGIQPGDRVAVVSNNRPEWAVLAYACYGLGAALVPMVETQRPQEWEFIVRDCEATALVASTAEVFDKCQAIRERAPSLRHLIGLERPLSEPESYEALVQAGAKHPVPSITPASSDVVCVVYTSGTTGRPKGVVLSHRNLASNITAMHELMPLERAERSLSFLPWAQSFGHTCELHGLLSLGGALALCGSVDQAIDDLATVRPTVLVSVPDVFTRIYDSVQRQVSARPPMIRKLFRTGLQLASKRRRGPLSVSERAALAAADHLIFSQVRAKLGGRLKYAISGGAALSPEVAEFIDNLGITVYEGYGLTEASPIIATNSPRARRMGSVGKPIPGVRVVIDKSIETEDPDHGEIIAYGPNVMQGYHCRPDETAAVLVEPESGADGGSTQAERGLRTGDVGYLDEDGFLFITGRVNELYKLTNGKFVAPTPLEEAIKLSPFISNVMIHGHNRAYNVALIVPDIDELNAWASAEGLRFADTADMLRGERVRAQIAAEIERCSTSFRSFERVVKFALVEEDFTTDNGLLTPTLRIKRAEVMRRHGKRLLALYEDA